MEKELDEEMEECLAVLSIDRKFEVYDIKWVIQDLSLATCSDNWSIQSPEFLVRGFHTTKWLIVLTPASNKSDFIAFTVKRCDSDSGPERMLVEWRLSISIADKDNVLVVDRFSNFSKGTGYKENLKIRKPSVETFKPFEFDLMTVQCQMMIYKSHASEEPGPCLDRGKNCLSENLLNLFLSTRDCDLELKIGDKIILAHKAIVCTRIERLNSLLEQSGTATGSDTASKMDVIDLSSLNYYAVMKVMEYIYSGDLKYVLCEPSPALYDCISMLDIWHLKECYRAKNLTFRTSMDVQVLRFLWIITNIYKCNSVLGAMLCDDYYSSNWELRFFAGRGDERDYFSISAESVGESKQRNMCFEFAITDESGRVLFAKSLRKGIHDKLKTFGFSKFVQRSTLRTYLKDNILRLSVKLKQSTDKMSTRVEDQDLTVVTSFDVMDSYDLLSLSMKNLFIKSDFSDVLLRNKEASFWIHKSIVSSRCSALAILLLNEGGDYASITLSNTKPNILWMILSYLYSGVLPENVDDDELMELCEAARIYNLPLLEDLCSDAYKSEMLHTE